MQRHFRRHTGSFVAKGADGSNHTIHVYTEYVRTSAFGDTQDVEGMREFVTATGDHVNWLKRGEYQIVETGEIITCSSPDAL